MLRRIAIHGLWIGVAAALWPALTVVRWRPSIITNYQGGVDNRFRTGPFDTRPNPRCGIPEEILAALAWDGVGKSYPLVDPSHVLGCHLDFPHSISFRDPGGRIHRRRIVESFTLMHDERGRPLSRVGLLDAPLPASIKPLKIFDPGLGGIPPRGYRVIGRAGRIGSIRQPGVQMRAVSDANRCLRLRGRLVSLFDPSMNKGIRLTSGDSGSPLLVEAGGSWLLAGVASETATTGVGADRLQLFTLASANTREMLAAGARPFFGGEPSGGPRTEGAADGACWDHP